jgi:trans-2,3-dihydro-3-hydroxyanthranilate isomerase
MQIRFVTVDVFTDRKFGGNQLAVVPQAAALTSEQMQSIAAEFNFAETTFVLPPQDASHTAEVRIFTPRSELPFAGHPNIGTAYVLATDSEGRPRALPDPMLFEEKAGLVRLSLMRHGTSVVGAYLTPPQSLVRGDDIDADIVAAACSLTPADIETANHRPCIASCGIPLAFAELKSRAALTAAHRPIASPAYCSTSRTKPASSICKCACSRRSTACRRTRPLAALTSRLSDCWRACGPRPI